MIHPKIVDKEKHPSKMKDKYPIEEDEDDEDEEEEKK